MSVPALRQRWHGAEILDDPRVPEHVRERCHRDLARTHQWLGNHRAVIRLIGHDPLPVRKVLDIGCGHGALLQEIRRTLSVEVVGVDLMPPQAKGAIPIYCADAIWEDLPRADVAVSVMVIHHFTPDELRRVICNVGRACRRFIILDLVRHWLPFALFRTFAPGLIHPVNVEDGLRSIERAFTPRELAAITHDALTECGGAFRQSVAPFAIRQIIDIRY